MCFALWAVNVYNKPSNFEGDFSVFFETTFPITSRDLDCFEQCRPSRLLGYLQEASALAMDGANLDNPAMMARYRCCWMVSRLRFTLDTPLRWRDELTVKTWHRGGDKAILYRDMDLFVNGAPAGQALAAWVVVDLDKRLPQRLTRFPELQGTDGEALNRQAVLRRLKAPESLPLTQTRTPHYSDLDGNGHVNNTRYADFFCDAIGMERRSPGTFLREMQLDFLHECRADQPLLLRARAEETEGFVSGEDPSGLLHFLAFGQFG